MSVGYSELEFDAGAIAGPARAAILLLAMGSDGASRLLKHLSPDEIRSLKESVADQQPVSAQQLDVLAAETVKRVVRIPAASDAHEDALRRLEGLTELKTAWHPIGA